LYETFQIDGMDTKKLAWIHARRDESCGVLRSYCRTVEPLTEEEF
jgi:hypothetical protein